MEKNLTVWRKIKQQSGPELMNLFTQESRFSEVSVQVYYHQDFIKVTSYVEEQRRMFNKTKCIYIYIYIYNL